MHKATREAGTVGVTWYLKILPLHYKQYSGELNPKLTDTTDSPAFERHLRVVSALKRLVMASPTLLQSHGLSEGNSKLDA